MFFEIDYFAFLEERIFIFSQKFCPSPVDVPRVSLLVYIYYEYLLTEKHRYSEFHATRDHQANKSFDDQTHKYQYNIKNSNYKK